MADGSARDLEARARGEDTAAVRGLRPAADGTRVPLLGVSGVASTARPVGPLNPALIEHARQRAESVENRIADRITAFSGSMRFVYIVMISQNRADAKRQVLADQEWRTVQAEDGQNQELLRLSHEILELTRAVHALAAAAESTREGEPTG